METETKTITKEEALEALDILSAQVGSYRLRKLWKAPIKAFIEAQADDKGKRDMSNEQSKS